MNKMLTFVGLSQEDDDRLPTIFEQMNAEFIVDVEKKKSHTASAPWFNITIGFLIVLDTILIGVEVDHARGEALEDRVEFFILNFAMALIFFVEMLIRQNQLGWDYFLDPWNVFDFSLVALNCADVVTTVSTDGSGGFSLAPTLRVLRLLRMVRMIRGLKAFYSLWMVIQGMLDSMRTMAWVVLMLFIILYCAAVALTTLVGQADKVEIVQQQWKDADIYLGSVFRSMWTMMQVVTLDSWATDIGRPLSEVSLPALVLVFLTIIVCNFGLLNIIIAVMIERVQTIAQVSKEQTGKVLENTEHDLLKSMGEDFKAYDQDENAELDFDEFRALIRTPSFLYKLRLLGIQCDEAESLFEIMDADKSGTVSPEEFIKGVLKLRGVAKGQDLVQVICFSQKQCLRAKRNVDRLHVLNQKADVIQARLDMIGKRITAERGDRQQAKVRNDVVWQKAGLRTNVIKKMDLDRQIAFPSIPGDDYM